MRAASGSIALADAPLGAQASGRSRDLAHQLVGMQAPFHEELALALADHRHGLGGSSVAMGRIDDLATRQVQPVLCRNGANLRLGTDEERRDQSFGRSVQRSAQRSLVAGMHDDCHGGLVIPRRCDQPVIFRNRRSLGNDIGHGGFLRIWRSGGDALACTGPAKSDRPVGRLEICCNARQPLRRCFGERT
jgi:hypothetical protein